MSDRPVPGTSVPFVQHALPGKRVRPTNAFIEFKKEEIEQSIPERFEKQVRSSPDRLAVKTRSEELTYEALNRIANRVAWAILARREQGGQEPVALLFGQSAQAIAAILGVLKAGQIYVCLDPANPRARTDCILDNAQPVLLVTNQKHLPLAHELAGGRIPVLNIDRLDSRVSDANPGLSISPDHLAYILATSGSTGQPKSVVHSHRNLLHDCMLRTNLFHINPDDRLTWLTFGTGQATKNLFCALLTGAALFPLNVKEEGVAPLADWLMREEITIYTSVVLLFRHFVATLTGREQFPRLRLVRMGSEAVSRKDAEFYKTYFSPDCLFGNGLSCNEAGLVRCYLMDKQTPLTGDTVPIGYALEDTQVLLLNDAGEEVGFNRIGEIVVKSRYLSPGYWRRPDLTQAVFRPDPEGGKARLYFTGDLGRMTPDGCLEFVGRKDFRVKIRGYRVETGEVEMALLAQDNVKAAAVVAREDAAGLARLVAYVVPASKPGPSVRELRATLAEKLSDYMIPSAFVMLDALPALPNGKVNRQALPAPGRVRPELDSAFVGPRTPVEAALAGIWAEVLGLDQVGIQDNFLELGGNSLQAAQVIARVLRTFQVELSLKALFEAPTVAEMAVIMAQHQAEKSDAKDMDRMLTELEGLSAEQVKQLLAEESAGFKQEQP